MAQLCSIYVNAHLEKGHRQLSPFEFVFDAEARGKLSPPGRRQSPEEQKAIFQAFIAAMQNAKRR